MTYTCQKYDINRMCRFDRRAIDRACNGCQRTTDKDYLTVQGLWAAGVSHQDDAQSESKMTQQTIFRKADHLDRTVPAAKVTTETVIDHIRQHGVMELTTVDLANAFLSAGVSNDYDRTERAIRQCVCCMVRHGMAVRAPGKERKRITKAGNESWPSVYVVIQLHAADKPRKETSTPDFATLNRAFLRF